MATAGDVINSALSRLGVVGSGQTASGNDAQLALNTLNELLDGWQSQGLLAFNSLSSSVALVVGTATYTIGPGGAIAMTQRPVTINAVAVTVGLTSYSLSPINAQQYSEIAFKQQRGIPEVYYYDTGAPTGDLTFWPIPSTAMTLQIEYPVPLFAGYAALGTTLQDAPAGYQRALSLTLAEELQDAFGRNLPQSTLTRAWAARQALKRLNFVPPILDDPFNGQGFSILYGDR